MPVGAAGALYIQRRGLNPLWSSAKFASIETLQAIAVACSIAADLHLCKFNYALPFAPPDQH